MIDWAAISGAADLYHLVKDIFRNSPSSDKLPPPKVSITASATPVPAVPGKSTVAPAEKGVAGLSQLLKSPDQSASRYDFFIAYATPDRRLAQNLCWFLQDDACEVFLGRVDELPDHNPDGRQVNKGQQGATERVIPGGNTPAWLELMEKPL
ncbi:MAG TPA: hypothetical protein VIH59_20805, partial [Candidatus Tectomicrobia bacterium]